MPGIIIPGGKGRNGFWPSKSEGEACGLPLEVRGCLKRPKWEGGKPGGKLGIALEGVEGCTRGGPGEDFGDDAGLLFEVVVVVVFIVELVVMAELGTTKLKGEDLDAVISS